MYEFPPPYWITSSWRPFAIHTTVIVVAMSIMWWMARPKRKAWILDPLAIAVIALVATGLLLVYPRGRFHPAGVHVVFLILLWGSAAVSTIYIHKELVDRGSKPTMVYCLGSFFLACIVVYLLLPSFVHPREESWRRACKNNLNQIALSLHDYHDKHKAFPMAQSGKPPHTWRIDILPYMDGSAVYDEYIFNEAWNTGANQELARRVVRIYQCPSDDSERSPNDNFFTAYAAVTGKETMWIPGTPTKRKEFKDGTSNTLMVVEACGQRIPWSEPRDLSLTDVPVGINLPGDKSGRSNGLMSSYHYGGVQVALADGSVRFLSAETDPEVIKGMLTLSGGEPWADF